MNEARGDWQKGVDENLASLNTGQRVNDKLIDDLDIEIASLKDLLHGTDTGGLVSRIEDIEKYVAELRAIVIMDASGKRGLQFEIARLIDKREDRRSTWANWTKIVIAIIGSGLITHFWQNIVTFFQPKDATQAILNLQKKPKHRHYVIHEEPVDDSE